MKYLFFKAQYHVDIQTKTFDLIHNMTSWMLFLFRVAFASKKSAIIVFLSSGPQ